MEAEADVRLIIPGMLAHPHIVWSWVIWGSKLRRDQTS
jgi:hypothetical protein